VTSDPAAIERNQNTTRAALRDLADGDGSAADRLWPLVYDELRALAESQFRRVQDGHTLQPTALVHEVFLRLVGRSEHVINDRAHFMAIAARAMRQILVDHARRKGAAKRGGGGARISLVEADVPAECVDVELTVVHEALERLSAMDVRKGMIVERRFFGGLTIEETAVALGVSRTTVSEEWRFARAWMVHQLQRDADE
jgi:RNA polymerase sigma factor (TIGR02999 family)